MMPVEELAIKPVSLLDASWWTLRTDLLDILGVRLLSGELISFGTAEIESAGGEFAVTGVYLLSGEMINYGTQKHVVEEPEEFLISGVSLFSGTILEFPTILYDRNPIDEFTITGVSLIEGVLT